MILLTVLLIFSQSTALAWKPITHVHLAEIALKDALDNDKVTLYRVDYESGAVLDEIGEFEVEPTLLAALRSYQEQFRAGLLGPDAYPDIATGQMVIHPCAPGGGCKSFEANPNHRTSNDWLEYLWRKSKEDNTLPVKAFVTGYLTHAAGDMFAHTFVNHFSGGDFTFTPVNNILKHNVLEGYIGKRTPNLDSYDFTISGVEDFIYENMVNATEGSELERFLLVEHGSQFSIPYLFSTLRNTLQKSIDDSKNPYQIAITKAEKEGSALLKDIKKDINTEIKRIEEDAKTLKNYIECAVKLNPIQCKVEVIREAVDNGSDRLTDLRERLNREQKRLEDHLKTLDELRIASVEYAVNEYKKHWVQNINRGLKEWPNFSHKLAKALILNENEEIKFKADLLTDEDIKIKWIEASLHTEIYVTSYLVYMLGAPRDPVTDLHIDAINLAKEQVYELVGENLAIVEVEQDHFLDFLLEQTLIGLTEETLREEQNMLEAEKNFEIYIHLLPGRGKQVDVITFNRDYLKIGALPLSGKRFNYEDVPAAYNTVVMTKLLLMKPSEINRLLEELNSSLHLESGSNVMLGFIRSLDSDNEWHRYQQKMLFAKNCSVYKQIFMKQTGETDCIVNDYFQSLQQQGTGKLKPIAEPLRSWLQEYFSTDLAQVRYAENINTGHGEPITIDNHIFFPKTLNLDTCWKNDIGLLIQELIYYQEYITEGNFQSFLENYPDEITAQIEQRGYVDFHNISTMLNIKKEALDKAQSISSDICSKLQSPELFTGPRWGVKLNQKGNGGLISQNYYFYYVQYPPNQVDQIPIVGKFNRDNLTDIGTYTPNSSGGQWLIKLNLGKGGYRPIAHSDFFKGDIDFELESANGIKATPLIGDFNGNGRSSIGLYIPDSDTSQWLVKRNKSTKDRVSFENRLYFNIIDELGNPDAFPIAGDFNGDRRTDIGVYIPSSDSARWVVKLKTGFGKSTYFEETAYFDIEEIGGTNQTPIIGDFNGDGLSDIGVYIPSSDSARWIVKINSGTNGNDAFKNQPYFDIEDFGGEGAVPIIGDFNGDGWSDIGVYIQP
jgi:hypothetical protein